MAVNTSARYVGLLGSKRKAILILRELVDIWNYRAQLSNEAKRNINPDHGDPFFTINVTVLLSKCFEVLQNRILDIIEIFVTKGSDTQAKALGIFFVLFFQRPFISRGLNYFLFFLNINESEDINFHLDLFIQISI